MFYVQYFWNYNICGINKKNYPPNKNSVSVTSSVCLYSLKIIQGYLRSIMKRRMFNRKLYKARIEHFVTFYIYNNISNSMEYQAVYLRQLSFLYWNGIKIWPEAWTVTEVQTDSWTPPENVHTSDIVNWHIALLRNGVVFRLYRVGQLSLKVVSYFHQ